MQKRKREEDKESPPVYATNFIILTRVDANYRGAQTTDLKGRLINANIFWIAKLLKI
jgi:hypothetical protein